VASGRLGRNKVVKVFIEGSTDDTNGNLRIAFSELFKKLLAGNMPRIVMGNDTRQTLDKFINEKGADRKYALIDLDKPESEKEKVIEELAIKNYRDNVFFMIQEMEAWFISQPNILDDFYSTEISKKIPKKLATEIAHPDEELQKWTKDTKEKYHKIKHGVELLQKLDARKLCEDFEDFEQLIKKLSI
jgi:hypothetical protein